MENLRFFIPEELLKEKLKITQKFFEVFKLIDIAKIMISESWFDEIFKDLKEDLEIKVELKKDEFFISFNCKEEIEELIMEEIVNSLPIFSFKAEMVKSLSYSELHSKIRFLSTIVFAAHCA